MESESTTNHEPLTPEEAAAKAAILAERERFAAAGITFVAVHFDGSGDSGVTEEVKCFNSHYYAYDEHEPVDYDSTHLQDHFEALVPLGYEDDCGGFGDVVLDVGARRISVERKATADFAWAPCCSNHCDTNSFVWALQKAISLQPFFCANSAK
jgi:hypothetical protein